ncbi:hypothetical protein [Candidatus Poriferisodalis sp.]|uniref:hypothetical protein n=1 Tax=Candidatus Poriferisodalis sp. TaxID=3101277 RepID=UPI003B0192EE
MLGGRYRDASGHDGSRAGTRRTALWASAGTVVVLVAHLHTAMAAGGPVAVPDIPAYLGIAQWVGGDGLALRDVPFQPGYGLLIAPLVAGASILPGGLSGESVHHLALAVNGFAAAAAAVTAGRLALVVSSRRWVAAVAGLLAAIHPSLSSASRIAWPETLLALAVVATALAAATAAKAADTDAGVRAWARAGLIAALSVALHARMVALLVAIVLTALLCRIGRRERTALGAGLLVGGGAAAVALTFTGTWPTQRVGEAAQLDRGLEPIATIAGQLLALAGGTVGLGLIGLAAGTSVAVRLARRRRGRDGAKLQLPAHGCPEACGGRAPRSDDPLTAVLLCLSLGALAVVLLGGWTLTGSNRADALLYGRYVDPWAVPLSATALAWLGTWRRSCRPASVLSASTATAVLACVVIVGVSAGYDAPARRIMTLSFSPWWSWLGGRLGAVAIAALCVAVGGIVLAATVSRSRGQSAGGGLVLGTLVAAVLAVSAVATVSNHRGLADIGAVARGQVTAAAIVSEAVAADGLSCLAHDETSVPDYALWLYRLEVPQIRHERVRLRAGARACSELVIAHDSLAGRCTNARRLIDEPAASWSLWQLPERTCLGASNARSAALHEPTSVQLALGDGAASTEPASAVLDTASAGLS